MTRVCTCILVARFSQSKKKKNPRFYLSSGSDTYGSARERRGEKSLASELPRGRRKWKECSERPVVSKDSSNSGASFRDHIKYKTAGY